MDEIEANYVGACTDGLLIWDEERQDCPATLPNPCQRDLPLPYEGESFELGDFEDFDGWKSESTSSMNADPSPAVTSDSSSYSQDTNSKESGLAHKKGRRTKEETIVLSLFCYVGKPSTKPKKEYLRVKLIRGFKRALRQVADKRFPRAKIHSFERRDRNGLLKWMNFRDFVNANPALQDISPTSASPDGWKQGEGTDHKCINDSFCREFFRVELVRVAFRKYLDLIFKNEDEKKLNKKFEFRATAEEKQERNEAWEKLRQYLYEGMFKDLGFLEEVESIEKGLGEINL